MRKECHINLLKPKKNSKKAKYYVFCVYKQRKNVCSLYLGLQTNTIHIRFMHFLDEILNNGGKHICLDKNTTKKVQLFFDVEVLTER